jgi:hypothetical protein
LTQVIGAAYPTTIATLSDEATIIDAFKYYHQGGLTNSPATNSIEGHFISINGRVDTVDTQLGYSGVSPTPLSVHSRLSSLETIVGTNLASTYIKSSPSSNDTPSTRNLISPTLSSIVPLTVQGVLGQTADLQRWRNSAETVLARIDSVGKFYSYDGTSTAEVVTLSGTQSLTNKTLLNPIQTVGTNARSSSYTLVLSDQSKIIEMSNGGTLTIPADASVNFPVGTYIVVLQTGSSQVTVAGSGFTPSATPGLKLRTQWSMASLIKRGTNSWVVAGDLSA